MHKSILLMLAVIAGCSGGSSAQPSSTSQTPQVINGITVPPEPDPIANATLLGVDSNNNGVRDDVDRQIATLYGADTNRYAAALQSAKSDQEYLVANGDPMKSTTATINAGMAGACIAEQFNAYWLESTKAIDKISPLTFNTPERMAAYRATSVASKEVGTPIPSSPCK